MYQIQSSESLSASQEAALLQLWNEEFIAGIAHPDLASLRSFLAGLQNTRFFFLTRQTDGSIGGIAFSFDRNGARWFSIVLSNAAQGKGFGKALMRSLQDSEPELNGWVIDRDSFLKTNGLAYPSPLAFYERLGFIALPDERLDTEKISAVRIRWVEPGAASGLADRSSPGITIRAAAPTDSATIYALICELEETQFPLDMITSIFHRNLADPDWRYWLAETGGQVQGLISLHVQQLLHHCGPVGEIQEFVIGREYRGRGIGRLLMQAVKDYAAGEKLLGLEVTTNKRRVENIDVYQRLGFRLSHNKFTIALSSEY